MSKFKEIGDPLFKKIIQKRTKLPESEAELIGLD